MKYMKISIVSNMAGLHSRLLPINRTGELDDFKNTENTKCTIMENDNPRQIL